MKPYLIYPVVLFMLFSACVSTKKNESGQFAAQNESQQFTWQINGESAEKAFVGDKIVFEGTLGDNESYNGELSYCWFSFTIWDRGIGDEYIYKDFTAYHLRIQNGKIKITFSIDPMPTELQEGIKKDGNKLSYPLECCMHIITGNGMELTSNQIPILYVYE